MANDGVVFEGDSAFNHYQVVDLVYAGRPARVLYSGNREAAQSGVARDDKNDMLFDYNQRFRELALGLAPKRTLLIGGGACTLPTQLLSELKGLALDIVEPDGVLLDIGRMYFGFKPSRHTRLYVDDGRRFLDHTDTTYDLILVDAFMNATIPDSLQTIQAIRSLSRHLTRDGVLAINIISTYRGEASYILQRFITKFSTMFDGVELFQASPSLSLRESQNFILTAQKNHHSLQRHIRSEWLELPRLAD